MMKPPSKEIPRLGIQVRELDELPSKVLIAASMTILASALLGAFTAWIKRKVFS